jgi:hypothetical protein
MMVDIKYMYVIDKLEIETLAARYLSCDDTQGAQALFELSERIGIPLNKVWIFKRALKQRGLWDLRRNPQSEA